MRCSICKANIEKDSKFCEFCGEKVKKDIQNNQTIEIPICKVCGSQDNVKYVVFSRNTGLLIMRQWVTIEGNLCRTCSKIFFEKYTIHNLLLGWWSVSSLLINPFIILANLYYYYLAKKPKIISKNIYSDVPQCPQCGRQYSNSVERCNYCDCKLI